ncbi:MAG: RnfH family protein [Methylococcaceae bacterium]
MSESIAVEVAYATSENQIIIALDIEQGSTIVQVIKQSGLLNQVALDLNTLDVGIFSVLRPLDYKVQTGDRIEIYRPLANDPKAIRRHRAEINPVNSRKKR